MVSPPELAVVKLGQWWWVPGVSVSKLSSASGPEQCEQPEAHRCTGYGRRRHSAPESLSGRVWWRVRRRHPCTAPVCNGRTGEARCREDYGGSIPVPVVATPRFTPPAASRRLPEHATTATTRALP